MARERDRDINDIIGQNVDKIRGRVEENVERMRENVDRVREQFEDVKERFDEAADQAISKGEAAWKDAVKFTQQHPAQALGYAALIGAALGVILFGRRRD